MSALLPPHMMALAEPNDDAAQEAAFQKAVVQPPLGDFENTGLSPSGEMHTFELNQTSTPKSLKLQDGGPTEKFIIGADERFRISPTTAYPFRAVAVIETSYPTGAVGHCTASFIGPDVLLTAAHCLYDSTAGGWTTSVLVAPGMDGQYSAPFGVHDAVNAWVPESWVTLNGRVGSKDWDWGLIQLSSPVGVNVGWFQVGALSAESLSLPRFGPMTIGYPGDKPLGTQWGASQRSFAAVTDFALYLDQLDVYFGQSGSGVFRGKDGLLVGIVSRGETLSSGSPVNVATRIDTVVVNDLISGCILMGCQFSYWVEPVSPLAAFANTWMRTDGPVSQGAVSRTWMWGPEPFTALDNEPYAEAAGGERVIIYFDKSRMEVTYPDGDVNSPWYVTNGLLVSEMVVGLLQTGDSDYVPKPPAEVNVAGDHDDRSGPTYSTFRGLLTAPALNDGQTINQRVDRVGNVWNDPNMDWHGVTASYLVDVPNLRHRVASPFWAFMNSSGLVFDGNSSSWAQLFDNPFYATGYPITEAYWSTVKVGDVQSDVLIQCFQRRCLTYTPSNPDGWQVEAGNVGQHYYIWRYGRMP